MKQTIFFFFFFLAISNLTFCQSNFFTVSAKVIDSVSKIAIVNFSLSVSNKDGEVSSVTYRILNDSTFHSDEIHMNFTSLTIRSIGYKKRVIILESLTNEIRLKPILLSKDVIELSEVKIKSKRNRVSMDSLKFNFRDSIFAGSKMAGDVLKLVPGLRVINDQIFYNDINIKNINVNGKNFFFGDNDFLLSNLPGFSIDKVEIIKPSINQKKYLDEQPKINIVLKEQSNKGYLTKSLASHGIKENRAIDFFAGKIDPSFQIGVNFDNNNVNNKNPLSLENVYSIGNLSNSNNAKIAFIKSFKNIDFETSYLQALSRASDLQEVKRIDNVDGEIFNSSYFNNSNNNLKKNQVNNQILYKLKPNSIFKVTQEILSTKNDFKNSTKINSNLFPEKKDYVFENKISAFKVENNLNYNFKDIDSQNKILSLEFGYLFDKFNKINNSNFTEESKEKKNYSNELKMGASLTYLFQNDNYFIISIYQNLNYLVQNTINFGSSRFNQSYNSAKLKFGGILKKIDYSVSAENYFYNFRSKTTNKVIKNNKILPVINLNYAPVVGVKIGGGYAKTVSTLTLNQLSKFSLNNDFLIRLDNYDVIPETIEAIEFTFEKVSNNTNVFINAGYLTKKDVVGNSFVGNDNPSIVLKNNGRMKTLYINSRQEVGILKDLILTGFLNYDFSRQKLGIDNDELYTKTTILEFNFGLKYVCNKGLDLLLTSGIIKSLRHFSPGQSDYRTTLLTSSLKFNYNLISDTKISMNTDLQYNKNNLFDFKNNVNASINLLGQRIFLKNENLILFLRINDLLNSNITNFQEYNSNTSVQYSKMTTIGRYWLLGLNYKFNTLKR